jgi:hypothetical protein
VAGNIGISDHPNEPTVFTETMIFSDEFYKLD